MRTEKFKDIFWFAPKSKVKAGEGLDEGRYQFYTSSQVLSKWINTEQYFDEALVLGTGGNPSIHYVNEPFSTSTDCIVAIKRDKDVSTKFIYYYLSENIQMLERGFKGAGLKHISKSYIEELEITLPNLETQNKIVAVLDKVKDLVYKRKEVISKYNELLRATFLDMFGDPATNPKKWDQVPLKSLCSKIVDCPHYTPEYLEENSNFYCVRSSDIQDNAIDLTITKTVSEQTYIKRIRRHEPQPNEVIYTREGGRLGNAARVPINKKICLGQRMMLFVGNEKLATNEFIWAVLNSDNVKNRIKNISGIGAAHRINVSQMKSLSVFKPPIDLQKKFGIVVNKIDRVKLLHIKGLSWQETLLSSVSQLAFSNQLDFNIAVDLEVILENDYEFFKQNNSRELTQLLLDRLNKSELNEKRFNESAMYDKAKEFVFELLKEEKVKQVFDDKDIKLVII